ncbi:MAG: primosomal protein N' [Myxococcales bacterium]|nr:primosomal protein N' [Myxococcales bacterium]
MTAFAQVAVDVPLDTALTYSVPDAFAGKVRRGTRVVVPFRSGAKTGLVVATSAAAPAGVDPARVRPLVDVLDAQPSVGEAQLALLEWIAGYYLAPIGEVARLALPPDGALAASRWVEAVDRTPDPALGDAAAALHAAMRSEARPLAPSDAVRLLRGVLHADLDALEASGCVVSTYAASPQTQARTTERYRLEVIPERLGAMQRRVVELLVRDETATAEELRAELGVARAVLDTLVERGVLARETEEVLRDPFAAPVQPRTHEPALTADQAAAVEMIDAARTAEPRVVLVHGVTGSGKTEVYVRAARAVVAAGQRVLVLLPEIALTPQFVGSFRAALGADIAVQHSALSAGERFDQWRRIRRGDVSVIIGARSALFAPIADLGLIIVDEEHDPSFKQQDGVMYHARDSAVVLAHRLGVPCVLGSATPSLESLANAQRGRYRLAKLPVRVAGRPMPDVELVDMAGQAPEPGSTSEFVSAPLAIEVREAVKRGEQAILFINRRGFAPTVVCTHCGESLRCTRCDISLTYHKRRDEVACHYCGFAARAPKECPTCRSPELAREGAGTEKIEALVEEAFGDLRVGRLDRDTSRGRGLTRILDAFRRGDTDVLVGTQMVTKGHDFPRVTVVGVVDADQALRFPDFRSGERTFQLLSQVAGRAGRAELRGRVVVQTYRPGHFVLEAVARHDFDAFAARELEFRRRLVYPPFGHLFVIRTDSPDYGTAWSTAERLLDAARRAGGPSLITLGPADSPIARVRDRYRVQALVRGAERGPVHAAARAARAAGLAATSATKRDVRWSVDVDALRLL